MQREEPYLVLTSTELFQRWIGAFGNCETGAAWLSSARVVKCWVKSRNERNPLSFVASGPAGNSKETASDKLEEGGDDVKSSWPTRPGLHTCYNGIYTKRSDLARASGPHKVCRSPDWSLQLDSMKSESLVIVDQNATVNTFPGLVHTARHTMGVGCKRSR